MVIAETKSFTARIGDLLEDDDYRAASPAESRGIGVPMKKELFDELLESVREGGAILRGEREPSRRFTFEEPDVKDLREKHGLSQPKFAAMMGISVGTLRNWEQGRRKPEGSARVLLRVVERHPEVVFEAASGAFEKAPSPTRQGADDAPRRAARH